MDERKLTGAAFALNILYSTAELKVVKGELKVWGKVVESGNTITIHCCGQCGSLLYRTSSDYPGMMVSFFLLTGIDSLGNVKINF